MGLWLPWPRIWRIFLRDLGGGDLRRKFRDIWVAWRLAGRLRKLRKVSRFVFSRISKLRQAGFRQAREFGFLLPITRYEARRRHGRKIDPKRVTSAYLPSLNRHNAFETTFSLRPRRLSRAAPGQFSDSSLCTVTVVGPLLPRG